MKLCRPTLKLSRTRWLDVARWFVLLGAAALSTACFGEKELTPYYGKTTTPAQVELRWSAGGQPMIFDPARAAASPDLDAVRALYEGLTDYDPQQKTVLPAIAQRWESANQNREWTFHLRSNALWSNGETVTAQDFVRSWRRVQELGSQAPHGALLENIVGMETAPVLTETPVAGDLPATTPTPQPNNAAPPTVAPSDTTPAPVSGATPAPTANATPAPVTPTPAKKLPPLGVQAIGTFTLKVRLQQPSPDFPSLVAHPVFRPVHKSATANDLGAKPVTNGPFRRASDEAQQVILEKSANYWDAAAVSLPRVRFVTAPDAETALTLYRAGLVDVVTNAKFEPLALKLLTPYQDFRRAPYNALTYYQFNPTRPPFDNVKVRTALALAIDRERLVADVLDGVNQPADHFLLTAPQPTSTPQTVITAQASDANPNANPAPSAKVQYDATRARALLSEAGFPSGANFPAINLLVNRNDQQRRVAKAVAAMWQRELGLKTEIVAKNWDEYQTALKTSDFALARRSVVLPTTEPTANLYLLFAPPANTAAPAPTTSPVPVVSPALTVAAPPTPNGSSELAEGTTPTVTPSPAPTPFPVFTSEPDALAELPAVPLYFASSYALVKPYISGFETTVLDAPSLKRVSVDTAWRPPTPEKANWLHTTPPTLEQVMP